jgi:hypothetical protein
LYLRAIKGSKKTKGDICEESNERVALQDYQFHRLKAIEKQKEEGRVLKIGLMEQGVNSSSTSSLESMVRG